MSSRKSYSENNNTIRRNMKRNPERHQETEENGEPKHNVNPKR